MILKSGEKIHIISRRLFEMDLRRHFIGVVEEVEGGIVRIQGYAYIFNNSTNLYIRRKDKRTRLFSMSDSVNIINILPISANLESTKYMLNKEDRLVITDEKTFSLDINEFGFSR